MGVAGLVLVANPGSASRKYALFEDGKLRAEIRFEMVGHQLVYRLIDDKIGDKLDAGFEDIAKSAGHVAKLFQQHDVLKPGEQVERIGLRVVAPGAYFLEHRTVDDEFVSRLEDAAARAPIHIAATLQELHSLRQQFPHAPVVGVSDSAFHAGKPGYAWNYGIPLEDADRFDIKRFGYHGLSAASVIRQLKAAHKLTPRLVICHLGSGASVTAVHGGKSADNTMGYSPLEGLVMSTRSGTIDLLAVHTLKNALNLDDKGIESYLNNQSGLRGLGGSADIPELLEREANGDERAKLALDTYIYNLQKAVGQMAGAIGGVDLLVLTGTVAERSSVVRERLSERLHYLDFILDKHTNQDCDGPQELTLISKLTHSKPIFVVPALEAEEIAREVALAG